MSTSFSLSTGKRELTMEEYEALPNIDINKEYNVTDHPNTGITNTQMRFALTCKRLFPQGSTFVCIDDGEYKKGVTYSILLSGANKIWQEVTAKIEIDTQMSNTSENPVQNKVIKEYIDNSITTSIDDSWAGSY